MTTFDKTGGNDAKNTNGIKKAVGKSAALPALKYVFEDETLLINALTHSSYGRENEGANVGNNERLEFLGDGFLDAIIAEELYKRLPDVTEGKLTRLRAQIVCESSLAKVAKGYNLGEYIRMGYGEEKNGGRQLDSILADAMEAVIAAVFLDGGYEAAKGFVLESFGQIAEEVLSGNGTRDNKTALQELLQANAITDIVYRLESQQGPDHDKTFNMCVCVNGKILGHGTGKSKKEAEQKAAEEALMRIEKNKSGKGSEGLVF